MDPVDFVFEQSAYVETLIGDLLPIEAIIPHRGGTFVLLGHWWREGQIDVGVHVLALPVLDEGDPVTGWDAGEDRIVSAPDGARDSYLQKLREEADFERDDYIRAWDRVVPRLFTDDESYEDSEASRWFSMFTSRPRRDALAETLEAATKARMVVVATAEGPLGAAAVFVADGDGRVHVSPEQGPLTSVAAAFLGFDDADRPDLEDFAEWVRDLRLYGPYAVSSVVVEERSGTVEAIASETAPTTI